MSAARRRHAGLNLTPGEDQPSEQVETDVFGFWIFLMSDAVLFALLFAIYGTMLGATAGAPGPASEFKLGSAFIETLILLTSSLTFGMATVAMKHDERPRALIAWLVLTLLLGLGFIALELNDFATMFADHATPDRSGFLSAFFALVATHGLHVTVGSVWIVVMLVQLAVFGRDARVRLNIMRLGLFWHFLDIVWVAIVSVVYLQGMMR